MTHRYFSFLTTLFLFGGFQQGRAGQDVIRLDPALDHVVASNARFEAIKSDYFGISEGPVWVQEGAGYLLFSDIGANVIYKWQKEHGFSVFLDKSGYTGDMSKIGFQGFVSNNGRLNVANFGSNGLIIDHEGRLILCAQGDRVLARIEKNGSRTILAERYEGKRFSRPNDVILKSNGSLYFTDRRQANNPNLEMPTPGVFLIKNGSIKMLLNNFNPNGIALSPDEKIMYINDTERKIIMRYDVQPDDSLANGRLVIDMSEDKAPGFPDGMKVDALGNIFCTGPGGIWIVSPQGKHIGTILLPEAGTNLNFGDADGKTLYVTDRRTLGRIRLKVAGAVSRPAAK